MTRGMSPSAPLEVSEIIKELLEKELKKKTIGETYKRRVQIIYDGVMGKSKYESKKELKVCWETANRWRKRWLEEKERLTELELNGISARPHELLAEIRLILSNQPGQGGPSRIELAQKEQIVALACEAPEDHGVEMTTWTHETPMIADKHQRE